MPVYGIFSLLLPEVFYGIVVYLGIAVNVARSSVIIVPLYLCFKTKIPFCAVSLENTKAMPLHHDAGFYCCHIVTFAHIKEVQWGCLNWMHPIKRYRNIITITTEEHLHAYYMLLLAIGVIQSSMYLCVPYFKWQQLS